MTYPTSEKLQNLGIKLDTMLTDYEAMTPERLKERASVALVKKYGQDLKEILKEILEKKPFNANKLTAFISEYWESVRGTCFSYTAAPGHAFNQLMIELACALVDKPEQESKPDANPLASVLNVLMPDCLGDGGLVLQEEYIPPEQKEEAEEETATPPSLPTKVTTFLKEHIESSDQKLLIPVWSLLFLYEYLAGGQLKIAPVFYYSSAAKTSLQPEEIARLWRHSNETTNVYQAKELWDSVNSKSTTLLSRLQVLAGFLYFNSVRGEGTEFEAGKGGELAIGSFLAFYGQLPPYMRKKVDGQQASPIPEAVLVEINYLRGCAGKYDDESEVLAKEQGSPHKKRLLSGLDTCLDTRRQRLLEAMREEKTREILDSIDLNGADEKKNIDGEARTDFIAALNELKKALLEHKSDGHDRLPLTPTLLNTLEVKIEFNNFDSVRDFHTGSTMAELTAFYNQNKGLIAAAVRATESIDNLVQLSIDLGPEELGFVLTTWKEVLSTKFIGNSHDLFVFLITFGTTERLEIILTALADGLINTAGDILDNIVLLTPEQGSAVCRHFASKMPSILEKPLNEQNIRRPEIRQHLIPYLLPETLATVVANVDDDVATTSLITLRINAYNGEEKEHFYRALAAAINKIPVDEDPVDKVVSLLERILLNQQYIEPGKMSLLVQDLPPEALATIVANVDDFATNSLITLRINTYKEEEKQRFYRALAVAINKIPVDEKFIGEVVSLLGRILPEEKHDEKGEQGKQGLYSAVTAVAIAIIENDGPVAKVVALLEIIPPTEDHLKSILNKLSEKVPAVVGTIEALWDILKPLPESHRSAVCKHFAATVPTLFEKNNLPAVSHNRHTELITDLTPYLPPEALATIVVQEETSGIIRHIANHIIKKEEQGEQGFYSAVTAVAIAIIEKNDEPVAKVVALLKIIPLTGDHLESILNKLSEKVPAVVKTIEELWDILMPLSVSHRSAVCKHFAIAVPTLFERNRSYSSRSFDQHKKLITDLTPYLPPKTLATIVKQEETIEIIGPIAEHIIKNEKEEQRSYDDSELIGIAKAIIEKKSVPLVAVCAFLKYIPPVQRENALENALENGLKETLITTGNIKNLLPLLPYLPLETISDLAIYNEKDLIFMISHIKLEHIETFIDKKRETVTSMTKGIERVEGIVKIKNFLPMIAELNPKRCEALCKGIKKASPTFSLDPVSLLDKMCMNMNLNPNPNFDKWLAVCGVFLTTELEDARFFNKILEKIKTPDECQKFCAAFKEQLQSRIKSESDLVRVLNQLDFEKSAAVCTTLREHLENTFSSSRGSFVEDMKKARKSLASPDMDDYDDCDSDYDSDNEEKNCADTLEQKLAEIIFQETPDNKPRSPIGQSASLFQSQSQSQSQSTTQQQSEEKSKSATLTELQHTTSNGNG